MWVIQTIAAIGLFTLTVIAYIAGTAIANRFVGVVVGVLVFNILLLCCMILIYRIEIWWNRKQKA